MSLAMKEKSSQQRVKRRNPVQNLIFMKVFSMKYLFLANDSVMLGKDDGELEGQQEQVLAKEYNCKGYCDSLATVQKQATHSRCCPDA